MVQRVFDNRWLPKVQKRYVLRPSTLMCLVENEPEIALTHPDRLMQLVEDARYMIARMERRLRAYRSFSDRVEELREGMRSIQGPEPSSAYECIGRINKMLEHDSAAYLCQKEALFELAEGVRKVAGRLENMLYDYRDTSVELGAMYEEIRGARNWTKV